MYLGTETSGYPNPFLDTVNWRKEIVKEDLQKIKVPFCGKVGKTLLSSWNVPVGSVFADANNNLRIAVINKVGLFVSEPYNQEPTTIFSHNGRIGLLKDNKLVYFNDCSVVNNPLYYDSASIENSYIENKAIPSNTIGQNINDVFVSSGDSFIFQIDIHGCKSIKYPVFKSSSGYGMAMTDVNGIVIFTYSNDSEDTGTYIELPIVDGAKYAYIDITESIIKAIGNTWEITTLQKSFDEELYKSQNLITLLETGYFDLSVGIGNIVDTSQRTSSSSMSSVIVYCKGGDKFLVSGYGGESGRLWGFLDADNRLIDVAAEGLHTPMSFYIDAPDGSSKFIYNTILTSPNYPSVLYRKGDILYLEDKIHSLHVFPNTKLSIDNDSYYNDGVILLGMKTNIPTNNQPFNFGYLFCTWSNNSQLYYGVNLKDYSKISSPNLNNKNYKFAISPHDGRIIMTTRNNRGSILIWESTSKSLTELAFNSMSQKPMGWLYNSGCCFDIDGTDEVCLFAEYSQNPYSSGGFNIWRGIYPYTDESMWNIVMHVPYVGDDVSGITHFHQVRRDPWTGIIYVTSGDASAESKWWYSPDHGLTFNLLTTGSTSGFEDHICRIINFIFTEDKVYFATDHGTNHCLNSIERNSQTGVLDVSTRQKLVDLPNGQATNFLCYSEFPKGIFMYDRWDIGYTSLSPIKVQFYSLESNTLIDVAELEISDTWGGHRGGCYVDYLSTTMETPAMGFDTNSPCIFKLNYPNVSKIGTIFYDILSKVIHTI